MSKGRTQMNTVKLDNETYNELKAMNEATYIPMCKIIKLALKEYKGGKNNESTKENQD